jgi:hypothetical protein
MHSNITFMPTEEFRGQNLQKFVPLAYAFGQRPNFFKTRTSASD